MHDVKLQHTVFGKLGGSCRKVILCQSKKTIYQFFLQRHLKLFETVKNEMSCLLWFEILLREACDHRAEVFREGWGKMA